tara:strand:- start:20 stop:1129 length:1110 start_codon:yes stop_codon:yes gene_type:complete
MRRLKLICLRGEIINILDNNNGADKGYYSHINIVVIFLSIITLVFELRYPIIFNNYFLQFVILEYVTLSFFTFDFILRIIFYNRRRNYLTGFYGIIDILTIFGGILSLIFPGIQGSSALRVFRVFRFARLLKLKRGNVFKGISGLALPYVIAAMAFKTSVIAVEKLHWFPKVEGISIVVSVIGFILAIMLGTKLNIANSRLHSVEDAICRIVGALKILDKVDVVRPKILSWASAFESALNQRLEEQDAAKEIRIKTDQVLSILENNKIGGPNVAGFSRDVSYVLHRSNASVNPTYDLFLRYVIISYTIVVIILVPSFIGIIASGLITYVLVGTYLLIDDMDSVFKAQHEDAFFYADLMPLRFYNEINKE